jgi:hypothetical protein
MKLRRLFVLLSAIMTLMTTNAQTPASAQNDGVVITERKAQFKLMLTFDFRRTWVNKEHLGFYGLRIGAQKGKDIIALGFYGIGIPFLTYYTQPEVDLGELGIRELRTDFDFTTLTYERIILETERWQWGVPFGIGLGNYHTSYRDDDGNFRAYTTNELLPVDLSIYLNYKITWWAFLGTGGGYRYVYARDPDISANLSNWTWFVKGGLRFGAIYQRYRDRPRRKHGSE